MTSRIRIELRPSGKTLEVEPSTPFQDFLFTHGVEFPCGGQGRCRGCRVRVLEGQLPPGEGDLKSLTPEEIAAGWRLACQARAESDVVLEVAQWQETILTDESTLEFTPHEGLGIAVDLGTTTLVAQLVDLQTGRVLAVETALNPQAQHGADVMSRVHLAVHEKRQDQLEAQIRERLGLMVDELGRKAVVDSATIHRMVIVGNTVMHHLFCGIDLEPLAGYPFQPIDDGLKIFTPPQLGWKLPEDTEIRFLPGLGGFVGSDILAGVLTLRLWESDQPTLLLDLGTNGEILVGNREKILCASTAAGPAFEGAKISQGMRAANGAIFRVNRADDGESWCCQVLGGIRSSGICGSGLVDAIGVGLEMSRISPSGKITTPDSHWDLTDSVRLTQKDIRELQLAKAAVAAGIRILLRGLGISGEEVAKIFLAGAFGNYIDRESARRIGLISFDPTRIEAVGNSALHGAKLALFADSVEESAYPAIREKITHISLGSDPVFQDLFVEEMAFPSIG